MRAKYCFDADKAGLLLQMHSAPQKGLHLATRSSAHAAIPMSTLLRYSDALISAAGLDVRLEDTSLKWTKSRSCETHQKLAGQAATPRGSAPAPLGELLRALHAWCLTSQRLSANTIAYDRAGMRKSARRHRHACAVTRSPAISQRTRSSWSWSASSSSLTRLDLARVYQPSEAFPDVHTCPHA